MGEYRMSLSIPLSLNLELADEGPASPREPPHSTPQPWDYKCSPSPRAVPEGAPDMKAGRYAFTEDTLLTETSPRNPRLLSFEVTDLSGQTWWPTLSRL